jgi:hypothetical protein
MFRCKTGDYKNLRQKFVGPAEILLGLSILKCYQTVLCALKYLLPRDKGTMDRFPGNIRIHLYGDE